MTPPKPSTSGTSGTSVFYDGGQEVLSERGDGLCHRCTAGRPRAVTRSGKTLPYCRPCWNEYFRVKMRTRRGR